MGNAHPSVLRIMGTVLSRRRQKVTCCKMNKVKIWFFIFSCCDGIFTGSAVVCSEWIQRGEMVGWLIYPFFFRQVDRKMTLLLTNHHSKLSSWQTKRWISLACSTCHAFWTKINVVLRGTGVWCWKSLRKKE